MLADDISRYLLNRRMHYSGARMQQGRVLLDSDWNEAAMLESEDRRLTIMETVCTGGSPNDGFRVDPASPTLRHAILYPDSGKQGFSGPVIGQVEGTPIETARIFRTETAAPLKILNNTYDFTLLPGSFYLGGLRFEINDGVQFLSQPNWPSISLGNTRNIPPLPTARTDAVYLEGWEETVSSTEDEEFRERALGGPDTMMRVLRNCRVRVLPGTTATDCTSAGEAVRAAIVERLTGSAGGDDWFDPESLTTFVSAGRIKITPSNNNKNTDPCTPAAISGFIGAENQTIRVQQTAPGRFIWGLDDAGPLFRVTIDKTKPDRLILLTTPRDEASFPLAGQAIELLPWGAVLDNGSVTAEATGELFTIAADYNPSDRSLRLSQPVPQGWIDWINDHPAPLGGGGYYYMRLWTGGPDVTYTVGTPVTLVGTGLDVTFLASGANGDYWIAAARPNTPDVLVPWALSTSAAPAGPVRFVAALALIKWTASGATFVPTVSDCRERFRSLCRIGSCCTVTVGDGVNSFGDTNELAHAVAMLPPEGGEICLLRGQHKGPLVLQDRADITVHGCGPGTQILPPAGTGAVIVIADCKNIAIRGLSIHTTENLAIDAMGTDGLRLETLAITVQNSAAINARLIYGMTLAQCAIQNFGLAQDIASGATPLVFLQGTTLLIERNLIAASGGAVFQRALGGLQFGGGSNDVIIRDNRIEGGNGDGIMLGSMHLVDVKTVMDRDAFAKYFEENRYRIYTWQIDRSPLGCIDWWPVPRPPGGVIIGKPPKQVPVSDGPIKKLVIARNLIANMGGNGISCIPLDLTTQTGPEVIGTPLGEVDDAVIVDNEIRGCVSLPIENIPQGAEDTLARGGIALAKAQNVTIARNTIEGCATTHDGAVCGIFVAFGIGLVIEDNTIRNNGRIRTNAKTTRNGIRGGVYVMLALQPPVLDMKGKGLNSILDISAVPAAVVHRNRIASTASRAVTVLAAGPVQVNDNDLSVHGTDSRQAAVWSYYDALPENEEASFNPATGEALTTDQSNNGLNLTNPQTLTLPLLADLLGAGSVLVFDLTTSQYLPNNLDGLTMPLAVWRGAFGSIAFNDNIVTLATQSFSTAMAAQGNYQYYQAIVPSQDTQFNVALITYDDVGCDSNQIACMNSDYRLIANLFTAAMTTRATSNRLREPISSRDVLSALTVGTLSNATALNQADHCIADVIALFGFDPSGRPRVVGPPSVNVELRLNIPHVFDTTSDGDCIKRIAQFTGESASYFLFRIYIGPTDGESDAYRDVPDVIRALEIKGSLFAAYQLFGWTTSATTMTQAVTDLAGATGNTVPT